MKLPKIDKPGVLIGLLFIHIGAILTLLPMFFSWKALIVSTILTYITGAFGVTLAYHRILTHRSVTLPTWLEYIVVTLGTLSLQGGPIEWVSTHRAHHTHSDKPKDPHDSNKGFSWAHLTWIYLANEATLTREQQLRLAHDIHAVPYYRFLDTYGLWLQAALSLALFFFGGWPCVIWGIFARLVITYHLTWLINSAAHATGYQSYTTGDKSTNCWWIAILSWGEGWHNNHHAFPFSARHGLRWFEIDHTWHIIRTLDFLGLARNIKLPTIAMQSKLRKTY